MRCCCCRNKRDRFLSELGTEDPDSIPPDGKT